VCLAVDGKLIAIKEQGGEYTHAENLTLFIQDILQQTKHLTTNIDAIAVSEGPGSYTGLRIGVSVAKGLCYSLDKPLISINTLQHFAYSISKKYNNSENNTLFCPMIDARRMEVYCGLYDINNNMVKPTEAAVITENSFNDYLNYNKIIFFGNGSAKCIGVLKNSNALFLNNIEITSSSMVDIAYKKWEKKNYASIRDFEPYYLKDFLLKNKLQLDN
jgi:tRNA threonylcarbamoyladenosine biosynthesis protein TsaB